MLKQNELVRSIRVALVLGVAGAVSMPVMAQDDASTEEATLAPQIVTGSRIKRADRETAQPVTILDRAALERTGLTSVGDIVQKLAEVGPAINTQFNNGGDGSSNVDLRNLGANRTLVLLNGRRWVPGLGGAVDLNTIPTAVIERIEVLKGGATTVYGSDAIAGVINIITRESLDGAVVRGFFGRNEKGDGERTSTDATIGFTGERGYITASFGYVKEDPIFARDRKISAVPNFDLSPALTGSPTSPFGQYGFGPTGGGLVTNSGNQVGLTNTAGQYRPVNAATDNYNFAPDNYLLTPQDRRSIFVIGQFELAENFYFKSQAMFNQRQSETQLAPVPVALGLAPGSGGARNISIATSNPYNAFGQPVTWVRRRFNDVGGRISQYDVDTFRFGGSFGYDFELADRSFSSEAGYSYTQNDAVTRVSGNLNTDRVRLALTAFDSDPGAGFSPVCGTAGPNAAAPLTGATLVAGCVPLNILGGPGAITQAMVDYVSFISTDTLITETQNYFANIAGDIFDLPAGPLGFSAGYEYRSEFGADNPDAIVASGATTGNSRLPTKGKYAVNEYSAEFVIPVLADVPFAEVLELDVAGRFSDYDTFGSTTNLSAGFQWKPISDLKIRGNYTEGFRAPNILELFRGRADSFPQLVDPCSASSRNAAGADPVITANCLNTFAGSPGTVTPGFQGPPQVLVTLGGEPQLQPEVSKNYTIGFVYNPSYVEGLDLTLDYWNYKIESVIGGRGAGTILNDCYQNRSALACARVTRDPNTGQISRLVATNENVGFAEISGLDISVGYKLPEFDFGQFRIQSDSTYFIEELAQNLAYNPARPFEYNRNNPVNSTVGVYGGRGGTTNRLKSNATLSWVLNEWSASWTTRYTSRAVEGCALYANTFSRPDLCTQGALVATDNVRIPRNDIGGVAYHDVRAGYTLPWDGNLAIGVNNVGGKNPPASRSTFANSFDPQYDVPGRFWYVSYTQTF